MTHSVLHADDPPHRLALGAAAGIFVMFTPTFGVQTPLVIMVAWLLRANKAIGVPIVWISNPATVVPIFYPCYVVGRALLGRPKVGAQWWNALANPPAGTAGSFYWDRLMEIALPLWVGCLVVATLAAIATYYVSYQAIRAYRLRRWGQLTVPKQRAVGGST